jgi:hypothetical protein
MSVIEPQVTYINQFFSIVDRLHKNNERITFAYLATKRNDSFYIIQAALRFNTAAPKHLYDHFQSDHVLAGSYHLSELGVDAREFVDAILLGKIRTPRGDLLFPGNEVGTHGVQYVPFHPEGIKAQARYDVLFLLGGSQASFIEQPFIDWELRAASTPYEGLQELANEYKIGGLRDIVSVELIAFHVAAVDYSSVVSNGNARIGVFLAHGSSTTDVKLGYRIIDQGRVIARSAIDGRTMRWTATAEHQYGTAEIQVPPAAVIHCFASYRGTAQHFGWIADPTTMQNPRRAVYNRFDENAEILRDFLTTSGAKGRDARDLETGVAWLLWMLGFSVAHLGGTGRTQDAADLIATTPKGDFAVIECTTGLLKAENKLPLLIRRVEQVRSGIVASNNKHLRVLPIIVTSRTRAEISADIEQAEKLGVLVVTKENLQNAVDRTLIFPNPEKMYEDSWEAVETARARYQAIVGGTNSFD